MSVHTEVGIGDEFLGYRIEALVGRGGMGVVYRAYDPRLKRSVALKLMTSELALDERFRDRFLRESELAASLEHPNVVPIHDAGENEGRLYLAMRCVEGSDLRALLRSERRLEPARALAIARQTAGALDAAHARGLVHRDVKPSNILLDPTEHAYLADFGLTRRLTDQHGVTAGDARSLGTPDYLAPEQIEGLPFDGRADLYSLGCLLYECLTGEPPFQRSSTLAVAWAHLEEEPPTASKRNPALPESIDGVIGRALAKKPESRYPTCGAFVTAAEEALGLHPKAPRRPRLVLLAAAAILVALVALAAAVVSRGGGETAGSDLAVRANTLVRIDPTTNAVRAVIDVGGHPVATAIAERSVWVYNKLDATVSEVDAVTNAVRHTTPVAYGPLGSGEPVLAADAGGVWVAGSYAGRHRLWRILSGGRGVRRYALGDLPLAVAVGEGAVWVVGATRRGNSVLRVDPATGVVIGRTRVSATIDSVAVGEGAVWAADSSSAVLYRVDVRSGALTGTRDLGDCTSTPVVGFGSVWACVCDPGSSMLRIDPRTLRNRLARNAIPAQTGSFAVGSGSMWWHDSPSGTVVRFDPRTGGLVATVRVTPTAPVPGGGTPETTSIASGAGSVWVTVART